MLKRRIVYGLLLVACLAVAISASMAVPFFLAMRERGQHEHNAIHPLENLRPEYLHNGFGVYILTFRETSQLDDDNATELLTLNRLPAKYDLTLVVETPSITDASIGVLSALKSVDTLKVDGSSISRDGIKRLSSELPPGVLVVPETKEVAEIG